MAFRVEQSVRRLADEAREAVRIAPVEIVLAVFVAAFFSLLVGAFAGENTVERIKSNE